MARTLHRSYVREGHDLSGVPKPPDRTPKRIDVGWKSLWKAAIAQAQTTSKDEQRNGAEGLRKS